MIRTLNLDTLVLERGNHDPDSRYCVMEAVAYVAGEPWSDHPKCVSPVIGAFLRRWNDDLSDDDRQLLKPLIPTVIGTADANETTRAWLAVDWLVRTHAPAFLRLTPKLTEHADTLAALPPLVDTASAKATKPARAAAGAAAGDAARAAARAAAGAAAGAAARAAAGAAARAAAGAAAWDAARAAARAAAGAAAWDAARAAAWAAAGAALRPTVVELQQSALGLVARMAAL